VLNDVTGLSVVETALHIVHEGTHARLHSARITHHLSCQSRIEALCVRQELEFSAALPEGGDLTERLAGKLNTPWWTEAALRDRHRETLASARVPAWLLRLYGRRDR
jgi:hypothetical protein